MLHSVYFWVCYDSVLDITITDAQTRFTLTVITLADDYQLYTSDEEDTDEEGNNEDGSGDRYSECKDMDSGSDEDEDEVEDEGPSRKHALSDTDTSSTSSIGISPLSNDHDG